jgi:hypothetical protein
LSGPPRASPSTAAAAVAALSWLLLGLRWFDAAAPLRPRWLDAIPPAALFAACLAALGAWAWMRRAGLSGAWGPEAPAGTRPMLLVGVGLAVLFRLPLAMQGGAGYVTPDGALSGIVALRLASGAERLVFVPSVAYSGSLKSHLTAALMAHTDPARAFALSSVLFYAVFVAAVFALGRAAAGGDRRWTATAAALYVAFAPAFVTRYSLSNDGNYVEVLALGTLALLLALRWSQRTDPAGTLALWTGLLLGLAFWCHVLALAHVVTASLWMLLRGRGRGVRAAPAVLLGFLLGAWPAVLWNATHGWETVRYLVPGGEGVDPGAMPVFARLLGVFAGQWPVLLGYDPGNGPVANALLRAFSGGALIAFACAVVAALRGPANDAVRLLLILLAVNLGLALFALPVIPGNPRYLVFSTATIAVLLARLLEPPRRRWIMAALVAAGAVTALAQAPGTLRSDAQWRAFVAELEAAGVQACHTDFYLATKVNFLSGERVACSAKLGPTITEYFPDFRARAESAPEAALIAVNASHAEKLERRLRRLGVGYERRDLMKPVLFRFSRRVDPAELFPDREFPLR